MAKTSSIVKNRYNEKVYDRVTVIVPKGQKEVLKNHANAKGESVNAFIVRAIRETMERDNATE